MAKLEAFTDDILNLLDAWCTCLNGLLGTLDNLVGEGFGAVCLEFLSG